MSLLTLVFFLIVTTVFCAGVSVLQQPQHLKAVKFLQDDENIENEEESQCGYDKCYLGKAGMLNVHIVPHTHDDVGWLNSVDGYFYETVQYILDTVETELENDASKKFIYVEMAFFYRWWHSLDERHRNKVKSLVKKGQMEFILGGWSMNDEASTHYSAIIDQHTVGFEFLKSTFGECGIPKIGWQVDPFGHSREQASLFAQFGFDGLFFARLDYQDYSRRKASQNLEHMWLGSSSLGDQASLFTGALYGMSYSQPGGFCFECGDSPVRDDPTLDDYNVDVYIKMFMDQATEQSKYFTTNHIMWTMGSDFQYSNARINFKNNEKLIKIINKLQTNGSKVNAFFSTPSCYLYALNKANLTYEPKSDDFFPYAHREHTFWTGYFTSRSSLKGYERSSNNLLQVCKQLHVLSGVDEQSRVNTFKRIMGVLQHHDAVSGTAKQFVTDNYAKMLANGVDECQEVIRKSFSKLLSQKSAADYFSFSKMDDDMPFSFCNLFNVSSCAFTEHSDNFAMVLYNPLATDASDYIKLPLSSNNYQVVDSDLKAVPAQFLQVSKETRSLPEHKDSVSNFQLVFPVIIPPLGYTTYFISKTEDAKKIIHSQSWQSFPQKNDDIVLENEYMKVSFSQESGLMKEIENIEKGITIQATQALHYYLAMPGDNSIGDKQASGAYIFRPNGTTPIPIATSPVKISFIKGDLVDEVHQSFNEWASQVVRLYKGAKHFEVQWTVGPIPPGDKVGKEVISRFVTSLDSGDTFYTDANGREVLKRVRDFRPTWKLQQTEPVSGNYYPVNSRIIIKSASKDVQFSVLNDRSQGGSSLASGQLELMLHRRLFYDDALGVAEPLNEPGVDGKGLIVRGTHYVILDTMAASTERHRMMARQLYMSPYAAFTPLNTLTPSQFTKQYTTTYSGLKGKMPQNVHLLTLERWQDNKLLVRLEHFFEKNEHSDLSKPASVSLKELFAPLKVVELQEQTLGANKALQSSTRLSWNVRGYGSTQKDMSSFVREVDEATMTVYLNAMQIRTFIIKLQ